MIALILIVVAISILPALGVESVERTGKYSFLSLPSKFISMKYLRLTKICLFPTRSTEINNPSV